MRREEDTGKVTQSGISHEERGRNQSSVSTSKKHQGVAGNRQNLGGRHGTDSHSETPGGTEPANTLILDFRPSKL